MALPALTVENLLPPEFPKRETVEAAVWEILKDPPAGPWRVILRPNVAVLGTVSVEVRRSPKAIAFASIHPSDSREQMARQLRMFVRPLELTREC